MGSEVLDDDMQELLRNMDVEELEEFATAVGDEQNSWILRYAVENEVFLRTRTDKALSHAIQAAERVLSATSMDNGTRA